MKKASEIAKEIVLKWGNEINWARDPHGKYDDHITPEDQKRLERSIAAAIRRARAATSKEG